MSNVEPIGIAPRQRKIRVAILTPGLASYRIPLLNWLSSLPNIEITALLCYAPQDENNGFSNPADWKFDYRVFRPLSLTWHTKMGDRSGLHLSPGLLSHLINTPYDVVICLGWTMPNTMLAWLVRKFLGKPVVVWDESIPHSPTGPKKALMPLIQSYIGSFDGYLGASSWCIDYLVSLGAARERSILFPQVADNDFFARGAALYRPDRELLKKKLGISTRHVILFVGQLIVRKGIEPLLAAFEQLAQKNCDVSLVMVGRGNLREKILEQRAASTVGERIFIFDFATQGELPKFYALADLFVLPSYYDTFGVVVDEAMASGLPVVTTNRVGAVADVVRDGVNGRIVSPGDIVALEHALAEILDNQDLRRTMSQNAVQSMKQWSLENAAEGFKRCIQLCLRSTG